LQKSAFIRHYPARHCQPGAENRIMADKKINRRQSGRPTINDVARLAQCSPMTVSRVVNGIQGVRAQAREAVEAAIAELNYAPNKAARSLAGAVQLRIALLYSNPSDAYLSEVLIGCLDGAGATDAHLVVERCDFGSNEERTIDRLVAGGIDGFLLPAPLCDDTGLLDAMRRLGTHVVLIGPGRAEADLGTVMIDDYRAAQDMTRHIIGLGHRRIGFVIGDARQAVSGLRRSGFTDAMAQAGLPVDPLLIRQGCFTYRSGFDAASDMLELPHPPTAIFASNDDMAAGCVAAAQRKHLDVPGNLTICGFDDTATAIKVWPELTTIRQPIHDMAQRAMDLLARSIHAERSGTEQESLTALLDYRLIRRGSDGACP
jgi:LacI family transcriptional regulator